MNVVIFCVCVYVCVYTCACVCVCVFSHLPRSTEGVSIFCIMVMLLETHSEDVMQGFRLMSNFQNARLPSLLV